MKKFKIIALLMTLSLITGFGINTKNPKLEQEALAYSRLNPVEIAKEYTLKSKNKNEILSKGNIEIIQDDFSYESIEIQIDEHIEDDNVQETEQDEVQDTLKTNNSKIQENKEIVDYIWQKESFGSIEEVRVNDSSKEKGSESRSAGSLGQKEVQIKITYLKGKEVSRSKTGAERILAQPKNTTIYVGSKEKVVAVDNSRFSRGAAQNLFALINEYRSSHGISKLAWSDSIRGFADIRAQEQETQFSHTRPNGQPWYSVSSSVAGENLAYGHSANSCIEAWKLSAGHNEVLLMNASSAGVSVYTAANGTVYTVLLTSY